MLKKFLRVIRSASIVVPATVAVLTACGGGRPTEPSSMAPLEATSQVQEPVRKILASAETGETASTTLMLRASADLAANVGPMVSVRVDGVVTDTVEVRASEPTDYRLTAPNLKPGSKLDIVYTNDAVLDGRNRNLRVHQISTANTFVVASSEFVTFDKGAGAAAFDGVDVTPGNSYVGVNGALRLSWPSPNLNEVLTVRASATSADGEGARMVVRADGIVVGTVEVASSSPKTFVFATPPIAKGTRVDVAFANQGTIAGVTRSLRIHYLMSGKTVIQPPAGGVSFDAGSGVAAFDSINMVATTDDVLTVNGALRTWWPSPNMTDSLTLRATARLADGVGPIVRVSVDGIIIGTVELRSTTPADITLPTLPMKPGQRVAVTYTNDETIGAEDRDLQLGYLMSGKTALKAKDNAINAPWPEPNLTDTLIVRARGATAGDIAPLMQVLIDDIVVGTAEVISSEHADYRFDVPTMTPGRKLDIAYINDGTAGGVARNLFIAYATTRDTVWIPTTAAGTYDRGVGAAAFDGVDVVAPSGNMYWGGALRSTWGEPNITSSITVRASAVPAGGVGALMTLWIDGVAVSATYVTNTVPADIVMPSTSLKPGSRVAVSFGNPGWVDGVKRQLNVSYLKADATVVTPASIGVSYAGGNMSVSWPTSNFTEKVTVRAYAQMAGGVGAVMQLRVDGVIVGSTEVRSSSPADHVFNVPKFSSGSRIDVVYINDATLNSEDRNLYVQYVSANGATLVPFSQGVAFDAGSGEAAFDSQVVSVSSNGAMTRNGALRFSVPVASAEPSQAMYAASRLLQQATFGPTLAEIQRTAQIGHAAWIDDQLSKPFAPDMVAAVQSRFDRGDAYRPGGLYYDSSWVSQRFWTAAATSPDQLRRRMGFALHQILMVSQADSNLLPHARAYAQYVDTLNRHALGNYRTLLEQIALSPVMGTYLSHIRNRAESVTTGRMPDENFARELMQLFTIGLHELNVDGTPKLSAIGQPIETYRNEDVMALAKAFTGWSWAFPDDQLTEVVFLKRSPDLSVAGDQRIDLLPMKVYPGMHSTVEKRLFSGKPNAVTMPTGASAQADMKAALDALFIHPNVGPFIGRQLIQHLVTSHPSPAYVARVAAVFNNNGKGVRGDLGAVARAILLDSEAITPPSTSVGKLREPVMRVAHWMRSLDATSASGRYAITTDLDALGQRQLYAGSVFGYFRPGYVPPNSSFSADAITVPPMQIVNEATTAEWVNFAYRMASTGLGRAESQTDVTVQLQPLADLLVTGQVDAVIDRLNLLLYAGRMSSSLKQDLMESMLSVGGVTPASYLNRARVAVFVALASPEYLVQR
ncbi:MAG: DUF1800 family protein [Rubrivivax sp.]|nr:MAG: DUF1800 family protein [Rubrivivax sp.]